jgi:hypothetical protein
MNTHDNLVDLRDVSVGKDLPKDQRIIDYIRQIKNPFLFKYKTFTITTIYTEGGPTIEDCLRRLVA